MKAKIRIKNSPLRSPTHANQLNITVNFLKSEKEFDHSKGTQLPSLLYSGERNLLSIKNFVVKTSGCFEVFDSGIYLRGYGDFSKRKITRSFLFKTDKECYDWIECFKDAMPLIFEKFTCEATDER